MKKGSLTKKELREFMNYYHDKWIELHNKFVHKISNNANTKNNNSY